MSMFAMFALVACKSQSQGPAQSKGEEPPAHQPPVAGSATGSDHVKPAGMAPDARARELLQHQIELARTKPDDLATTFGKSAIVIVGHRSTTADGIQTFGIGDGASVGATITKAEITKLVADGNGDAVWFYAEVTVQAKGPNGEAGQPGITRVVELLSGADQWRAVAASFESAGELQPSGSNKEIEDATTSAGPLAKLLASTTAISSQLAPNAIAVGPAAGQLAQGADAKSALVGWKLDPLSPFQRAREVTQPTWGFVQAHFDHPHAGDASLTDRVIGQAFGVPKSDGTWSIVLVQYAGR
ncbi:MAG TPA: hypothetical protein VMJ10_32330 [Kofleriaceae bacterium]|nr:hypothetical protein [Kofleriaceae bacterium]